MKRALVILLMAVVAAAMLALARVAGPEAETAHIKAKPPSQAVASAVSPTKRGEEEVRPPFEVPTAPPGGLPTRPPESRDFPAPEEMTRMMKEQLAGAEKDQGRVKGK